MIVDRFLHTAMFHPGNYGSVPRTLAEDDDTSDALIVGPASVGRRGAVVRRRPIGALMMKDEQGPDEEEAIAVPVAPAPRYEGWTAPALRRSIGGFQC